MRKLPVGFAISGAALGLWSIGAPGQNANSSPAAPPDPLSLIMQQAPSIDTNSPVVVESEFDPPVATLGHHITYRIKLNAMDETVRLPEQIPAPPGLDLTAGGRGQNYLAAGPKLMPHTSINYRVAARNPGVFTMPAFSIMAYGRPFTVPAAQVTVLAPGVPGAREGHHLYLELPLGDLYVGQAIPAQIIVPDPGDGSVQGMAMPQLVGTAFQLDPMVLRQMRRVANVDGKAQMAVVTETVIYPIKSGPQTLLVQVQAYAIKPPPAAPGSIAYLLVDSDPIKVSIQPLPPANDTSGFTGAIGNFQLAPSRLSTNQVRAGNPVTLTVTIQGEGNIGRWVPPKLGNVLDWQAFPPMSDGGPAYLTPQRATRSFTYTLIPLRERVKGTPPIPFCYFDPQKKAYLDLTIPSVPLKVDAAPGAVALPSQTPPARSSDPDAEETGRPERELTLTGLRESPGKTAGSLAPLPLRPFFLALQFLPGLLLGGLWAAERRRQYLALHPEVLRKRRARRGLRRNLRLLQQSAATRDAGQFVLAGVNALREVCAPHSAANPEALVCTDVLGELSASSLNGQDQDLVRRFFSAADAWRILGRVPDEPSLFAAQPKLETLLYELARRL